MAWPYVPRHYVQTGLPGLGKGPIKVMDPAYRGIPGWYRVSGSGVDPRGPSVSGYAYLSHSPNISRPLGVQEANAVRTAGGGDPALASLLNKFQYGDMTEKRIPPNPEYHLGRQSGWHMAEYKSMLPLALAQDVAKSREAAQENYRRGLEVERDMAARIKSGEKEMLEQGLRGARELKARAGEIGKGGGARADRMQAMLEEQAARADLQFEQFVQGAFKEADAAKQEFEKAIRSYKDMSAANASAVSSAIQRDAENALNMVRNGVGPDGRLLSPDEIRHLEGQIRHETSRRVQETLTPIVNQTNENLARMRMELAGLRKQIGEMKLGAAGLYQGHLGQKNQLYGAMMQNEQARQQLDQLTTSMLTTSSQMAQAAVLSAAKLGMEGRTMLAQMIRENPRTHVGMVQGLIALIDAERTLQAR